MSDEDSCAYCSHDTAAHGRSGCLDCACIEDPAPYDPSDY